MNKYLVKIAAFQSPDQVKGRLTPKGMRHTEWLGKGKTIDHDANAKAHASASAATRGERLNKAKSLLTKKKLTIGIKTGLGVAAAAGTYHLGKSILNNLEP